MQTGLVIAGLALTLIIALLGWIYQLGFMGARVQRNEKDIDDLKKTHDQNEKDLRTEIRESFNKVYAKLDSLPCKNPRWNGDDCK